MPLIVATLVYGVIGVALYVAVIAGFGNTSSTDYNGNFGFSTGFGTVGSLVFEIVLFVYGAFVQAATLSGILDIADGRPVTVGSFFRPRNFGAVILAALLVGLLSGIGYLLCIIPGVVFTFFAMFTIAFVVDRNLPAFEALKASFTTVRSDIGSALLSWLVQALLMVAGIFACGVGILVGAPLALLIQVYTYRRLAGGPLAPLTP